MILQFYIKSNVSIGLIISVIHKGFTLSKNANTIQFGKRIDILVPILLSTWFTQYKNAMRIRNAISTWNGVFKIFRAVF